MQLLQLIEDQIVQLHHTLLERLTTLPMGPPLSNEQQLEREISQGLAQTLRDNPKLSAVEALQKVTQNLLFNNPFVPPKGCPVNDLPNELLAHIFLIGTRMDEEDDEDEDDDEYHADGEEDWSTDEGSDDDVDEVGPVVHAPPDLRKRRNDANRSRGAPSPESEASSDEDDDDEDDEVTLPFQVLVSHVCRHWREVAVESPSLWTTLTFTDPAPYERSRTWLARSKNSPIDIYIDCTIPENWDPDEHADVDDSTTPAPGDAVTTLQHAAETLPPMNLKNVSTILDMIIPHINQWRLLEVTVSLYETMHLLLTRLAQCPPAPILEVLELYHYEDCEEYENFQPPYLATPFVIFEGNAPNLKDVAFWGVHLDWDNCLPFLSGLRDVELAYHARNVRPSYETFSKMLTSSPDIRTLTLCLSGPAGDIDSWPDEPIELPSLKDLVLCYHDPEYAVSLLQVLVTPNVHSLALDYDSQDYSLLARQLVKPMRGRAQSLLSGLEHLKISGLPCSIECIDAIYRQLVNLKSLNLNCSRGEDEWFERLRVKSIVPEPINGSVPTPPVCPNLETLTSTGMTGTDVCDIVRVRQATAPLKKVFMCEEDDLEEKEEKWLRDNLETLDFFELSDSEEEVLMAESDEEEVDGMEVD